MGRAFTVKKLAERYGVSEHTILAWIRSGELRAIDVSPRRGGRPKWRITPEALEAFELLRTASPPPAKPSRRKKDPQVIEFY